MHQTQHTSLTALLKVIKQENPQQFAVLIEDKELSEGKSVKVYNLSRPWVAAVKEEE